MATPPFQDGAEFELFFDGECPLCVREVSGLRRLDRGRGRLALVDITDRAFDAASYGKSQADLMARIHGRLPDATWVEGVDVFRRAYGAVGLGWLVAPTAWPGLRRIFDAGYRVFARNRLRLTGRHGCDSVRCAIHSETVR